MHTDDPDPEDVDDDHHRHNTMCLVVKTTLYPDIIE